jgi:DNA mismatch repair protein MutS
MNISTTISPGTNGNTPQEFPELSGELPDERPNLPLSFGQSATTLPPRERSLHGNGASAPAHFVEREPMTFQSILFTQTEGRITKETPQVPEFFVDLNLDQIIDAITASKEEYNLKPFFHTSLHDIQTIHYRHAIFRDLQNDLLFKHITSFARKMRATREHLAQGAKLYHYYQKCRWFLEAVEIYCDTIACLAQDLSPVALQSPGFMTFRDYLTSYAQSERFTSLQTETKALKAALSTVKYSVLIKGCGFKVRKYEEETDYSSNVEETFAKFKQGAVKNYAVKFPSSLGMNSVEEKVLDFVALLYPEIFLRLDSFCKNNHNYLDPTIGLFDREIQFYISFLEYIERFKRAGLSFCYPQVSTTDKEVYDYQCFDLALADKLRREESPIVCNDFYLKDQERIFVVSGPNQGGKTTFARTFGQLHYLGSIGCLVPGRDAKLFLFDRLFTHFEKEENIKNLRGKLEDDLFRIHGILQQITSQSIVIMNESFTSTTLRDAIFISKRVLEKIIHFDLLCVCVTFIDELASLSETTVSMVSTVVPKNPASRTYKIERRPADGLSYAISIAEKYQLTYSSLKERLQS